MMDKSKIEQVIKLRRKQKRLRGVEDRVAKKKRGKRNTRIEKEKYLFDPLIWPVR